MPVPSALEQERKKRPSPYSLLFHKRTVFFRDVARCYQAFEKDKIQKSGMAVPEEELGDE